MVRGQRGLAWRFGTAKSPALTFHSWDSPPAETPSRNMVTVGVVGLLGKTTTSWLVRGILEELGQTVGLMSSIEHAIAEDRLDEDGYLWEPLEEDPSADRESSVPFKLIPYEGECDSSGS